MLAFLSFSAPFSLFIRLTDSTLLGAEDLLSAPASQAYAERVFSLQCYDTAGCFEVKVWADTAKFTDVIVTRLRKCSDLIREGKVFVGNKTKVASRVGCSESAVLYFTELLFKSNKKKFSFRRVESEKIRRDLL